jgi:sodium/pantothenate symporter
MAYFELAGFFGPWLLWTVLTTTGGLLAVRFVANRIAAKLSAYGSRIPTLHEFIGVEFDSRTLILVGAAATSLGYLGAYAVELTVGSRLFAMLVPGVPEWLAVVVLAAIGLTYTAAGGFRAVVLTDRLQMATISLFIAALCAFFAITLTHGAGITASWSALPVLARTFAWRDGLGAFLLGVFVINVPSYVSDISMWQRVSSMREPSQLRSGLARSALSATVSWGLLAALAILAPAVAPAVRDLHPVASLLVAIASTRGVLATAILFVAVAGLFAAMMSTASTLLVAVAHTVFEDVLSKDAHSTDDERADSSHTLRSARVVILGAAIGAVAVVELLSYAHFTIADFVFAIYGAQLALFPPVCAALYVRRDRLRGLSRWATAAIGLGFAFGWTAALYGKFAQADTLVFLAPVVSLSTSALLLVPALLIVGKREARANQ